MSVSKTGMFFISMGKPVTWKVYQDDKDEGVLPSKPDWNLINPLAHGSVLGEHGFQLTPGLAPTVLGVGEGFALVKTPIIGFAVSDWGVFSQLAPSGSKDRLGDVLETVLPNFGQELVPKLRFVTKQASLANSPGFGFTFGRIVPTISFPQANDQHQVFISSYDYDTAVTYDKLTEADKLADLGSLPIYDSLLLDAIQALIEADYRRALLYATIAMETCAALSLEVQAELATTEELAMPNLRIVPTPGSGGAVVRRDPVYSYLRDHARNSFRILLHELPLYQLGRSLQLEAPDLQRRAVELYQARNKIVHQGELPLEHEFAISMDKHGAHLGIETALEVCQWFGMTEEYSLPDGKAIELRAPLPSARPDK